MSVEFKPKILVAINPQKVTRGQMIAIQAQIFDQFTNSPMPFEHIYMQIVDDKGVEVWPVSTMEINSFTMNKLISTSEMDPGKYLVRVSFSKKFSPIGVAGFEIERGLPLAVIPLIPPLILATTSSSRREKIEKEFVGPDTPPQITWLVFQTEKDARVCHLCRPNQGKVFRPDDPQLIRIPIHPNCRCHYDFITEEQELATLHSYSAAQREYAYQAYTIAQVYWAAEKGLIQMEVK